MRYDRKRHEETRQGKARGKGQGAKTMRLQVLVGLGNGEVAELVGFIDCLVE